MTRHRVLISDPLPPVVREILEKTGRIDVLEGQEPIATELPSIHGWIIRSATKIDAAALGRATALKCICRAGAGVDNVDLKAAAARGIVVMNTADANSNAAAEHTIGLMLALARHIPAAARSMAEGKWDRAAFTGVELAGKTLAVIGLGKIGRGVAAKARGLGMRVIGFDPVAPHDETAALGVERFPLLEIWPRADFITVHVPLNDETRGLVGRESLSHCKYGVRVVNCARGGIVDIPALLEGLESGRVAGAAIDVYEVEPLAGDSPLRTHPRIVCTPHLGASTVEAQDNVGLMSAEQIRDCLLSGEIRNRVV